MTSASQLQRKLFPFCLPELQSHCFAIQEMDNTVGVFFEWLLLESKMVSILVIVRLIGKFQNLPHH